MFEGCILVEDPNTVQLVLVDFQNIPAADTSTGQGEFEPFTINRMGNNDEFENEEIQRNISLTISLDQVLDPEDGLEKTYRFQLLSLAIGGIEPDTETATVRLNEIGKFRLL